MTVKWIAEPGSNHNGDLNRAIDLIQACKWAGFDAVKFQYLDIEAMFAPKVLEQRPELSKRSKYNFDPAWLPVLRDTCHEAGMEFGISVYRTEQVNIAKEYVDFWKIASYNLLGPIDLFARIRLSDKPVIISTGLAYLGEIRWAVNFFDRGINEVTIFHCVSFYPTPPDQCNLTALSYLKDEFWLRGTDRPIVGAIGWSDHTGQAGVIHRAVHKWGAEVIELHVDLNDQEGSEKGNFVWTAGKARQLIRDINIGFQADGDGHKRPRPGELTERDWRADPADGLRPMRGIR